MENSKTQKTKKKLRIIESTERNVNKTKTAKIPNKRKLYIIEAPLIE